MKILKAIILVGIILMMLGCSNTQSKDLTNSATVNTDNSAADSSKNQASATTKDLKSIVEMMPRYSADYDLTASGETSKITMYIAPPKYATSSKTAQGEVKSIFDDSSVISCTNMQGVWQCFKMEIETPANIETENSIKSGEAKTTFLGACSKAGETGLSYEIDMDGEKSTVCYSLGGILLEMKSRDMVMTATKVTKSVSESDFTPPAEPKDISSILPNAVVG